MQTEQNKTDPSSNVGDSPEDVIIETTEVPAEAAAKDQGDQQEKVQQVKHSDFKRIKEEAKAKGKAEALSELDEAAKAVGFASHADALKALAELKKSPPAKPAEPTPPPKETQTMPTPPKMKADKDKERAEAEARRLADEQAKAAERKRWRAEERRRRELQAALDAKDAEMGLREEMYRAGVADVDYTLRLLTRELEGKTEEEIAAFNRSDFYGKLRTEKPYLFGEKVAPATTGTNGTKPDGSSPAEPKPGESAKDAAASTQFNAREAKPADVQARLRALGLNPHM